MRQANDLIFFDDSELIPVNKRKDYSSLIQPHRPQFEFDYFDDASLFASKGNPFLFDLEVYPNYFLAAFQCYITKKIIYFEQYEGVTLDVPKLLWVMHQHCLIGFNNKNFDEPILWLALTGVSNETLKNVTDFIIKGNWRPQDVEKAYNFRMGNINSIDLIEPSPLRNSLKGYMARLFYKRLQELVYPPETILTPAKRENVKFYCFNDLEGTGALLTDLCPQLELRAQISQTYGLDVRSKSDPQIAEAVIVHEVTDKLGYRPKKPKIEPGTAYTYNIPHYIKYQTPLLQNMLEIVRSAEFVIDNNGSPIEPEGFKQLKELQVGFSTYRMGIGGLHSTEECIQHVAADDVCLSEFDVGSYYPWLILTLGLYPTHLTPAFLDVYRTIVTERMYAKKRVGELKDEIAELKLTEGNEDKIKELQAIMKHYETEMNSKKLTCNGSFGKFGSKYSMLYSPDLMIQVTVSGQIALLMLIETLELDGISVVSGNTDGIVLKYDKSRYDDVLAHIKHWENVTGLTMEESRIKAMYSMNVNNYIEIKDLKGKIPAKFEDNYKAKGCFSKPGLSKNPTNIICVEAATALIVGNIPIEKTIRECRDINKFLTVRTVKGGAEKDNVYLGKIVRWYMAKNEIGHIAYIMNSKKVAKSDGAKPLMDIPSEFPGDIDYDRYIEETQEVLRDIAYYKTEKQIKFF